MKYNKFLTFSYDDGVTQDQRLIDLFDKYGMKCTFNLNTALGGMGGGNMHEGVTYSSVRYQTSEYMRLYKNHEVAVHTLTHPWLTRVSDEDVIREVEQDRKTLSEIMGYNVVGMAYPMGAVDDRVIELIGKYTGVKYSRTTKSTYNFEPQSELLRFNPTLRHTEWDKMFELGEKFINLKCDKKQIYYVWGHAYEFDYDNSWSRFEDFLKMMSGHEDICYCNNTEALL